MCGAVRGVLGLEFKSCLASHPACRPVSGRCQLQQQRSDQLSPARPGSSHGHRWHGGGSTKTTEFCESTRRTRARAGTRGSLNASLVRAHSGRPSGWRHFAHTRSRPPLYLCGTAYVASMTRRVHGMACMAWHCGGAGPVRRGRQGPSRPCHSVVSRLLAAGAAVDGFKSGVGEQIFEAQARRHGGSASQGQGRSRVTRSIQRGPPYRTIEFKHLSPPARRCHGRLL